MGESRDAAADSRVDRGEMDRGEMDREETDPSTGQIWSPLYVGVLFVAAAAISPAVHALSGDWPAGYGGRVAAAFAVVGVCLLVYAFTVES